MRNVQEIIGFLLKNSVIFKSVCFNNDRAITQNTPICVENCSDDQLSYMGRDATKGTLRRKNQN